MELTIRPIVEGDLRAVDKIFRIALGTLLDMPDPERFGGDADWVRTRWRGDPHAAFVALTDDQPVGSIFAARRGSVAIVGPVTVHPDYWDRAVGTRLLQPVMNLIDQWGCSHTGLHTVVHSAKHISLYRKFGFWPRCLIEVMAKTVQETKPDLGMKLLSELTESQKTDAIGRCLGITESFYPGLDVTGEIRTVDAQGLGDTAMFYDGDTLDGFAVCHWGAGTEAGTGRCYIKFGAVRKGSHADDRFRRLLRSCEVLAAARGGATLVAGVNTARNQACRVMIEQGFYTDSVGVAMHRPYKPGYNRDEIFAIDDWR